MAIKRCGTCHFAKIVAQDLTRRVCWGAPPSAVQTQLPGGRVTMQMTRPIVSVADEACALYRVKAAEDVARDEETMRSQETATATMSDTRQ